MNYESDSTSSSSSEEEELDPEEEKEVPEKKTAKEFESFDIKNTPKHNKIKYVDGVFLFDINFNSLYI